MSSRRRRANPEGANEHIRNALTMVIHFPLDENASEKTRREQHETLVAIGRRLKAALEEIEHVYMRLPRRGNRGSVRRGNPALMVLGNPNVEDATVATWAKIEYMRPDDPDGKDVVRVHEFKDGFEIGWLSDGSVQLSHPRHPLWTDDER